MQLAPRVQRASMAVTLRGLELEIFADLAVARPPVYLLAQYAAVPQPPCTAWRLVFATQSH